MFNEQKVSFDTVRTLVVIDDAVQDFQSLVKALLPSSGIIVIQPNHHEVEQITQVLNKFTRIKNLHIISNGSPGCLYLGKSHLSLFDLNSYTSQLKNWSIPVDITLWIQCCCRKCRKAIYSTLAFINRC